MMNPASEWRAAVNGSGMADLLGVKRQDMLDPIAARHTGLAQVALDVRWVERVCGNPMFGKSNIGFAPLATVRADKGVRVFLCFRDFD